MLSLDEGLQTPRRRAGHQVLPMWQMGRHVLQGSGQLGAGVGAVASLRSQVSGFGVLFNFQ